MQTNPESAAVEAVAWLVTSDDARVMCYAEGTAQAQAFELRKGGYPARIEPLYPQSALDALRGEVERLRVEASKYRRLAQLLDGFDFRLGRNVLMPPATYLDSVEITCEFQPGIGQTVIDAIIDNLTKESP